jgi:hypothetical protein
MMSVILNNKCNLSDFLLLSANAEIDGSTVQNHDELSSQCYLE